VKLSVIIVNYNVRFFLEQAVSSALKALEGMYGELIVVDNASKDGSDQMMKERFPEVRYIYLDENVGFSRGNNHGIKASKGEYVLLLNPDTVVAENAFEKSVAFMDSHPDAGGLGVHMIDGSGDFLPESKRGLPTPRAAFYKIFGLSSLFPKSKSFGQYHVGFLDKEDTHEVDILSGAYMMMRRTALDKAGLLDEAFFMYGEDIDLSYRLVKAGYKNYYYPESRIIHYKGESTKKGSVNYVFVFYRAMVIFAKKHFDKGQASLFGLLIELAIYFRAGLAILRRLFGGLWQAGIDALTVFGIFYLATEWYGEVADKQFDLPFILPVQLGYTFLTVLVLLYSSVYNHGFRFARLFKGWLIATLVLLGFYSMLPEIYRFSRAVLLMGSTGGLIAGLLWRTLLHSIAPSIFQIQLKTQARYGIVGNEHSLKEIQVFIQGHNLPHELVCGVQVEQDSSTQVGFVGQMEDLPLIIEDFRLSDIVFDTRVISSGDMIRWMERLAPTGVRFRMAVGGTDLFIIGSQEAIGPNDTVARGELERVNVASIKRIKRTSDLLTNLVLLLFSPILILWIDEKGGFIKNLYRVAIGKSSWVGFDPRGAHSALPPMKPGVVFPLMNRIIPNSAHDQCIAENVSYLKEFHLFTDIGLVTRHVHLLGRNPIRNEG